MTKPTADQIIRNIYDEASNALRISGGGGGGSTTFTGLTDTPSSYTGTQGYLVRVNSAATGLEFFDTGHETYTATTTITSTTPMMIGSLNTTPDTMIAGVAEIYGRGANHSLYYHSKFLFRNNAGVLSEVTNQVSAILRSSTVVDCDIIAVGINDTIAFQGWATDNEQVEFTVNVSYRVIG